MPCTVCTHVGKLPVMRISTILAIADHFELSQVSRKSNCHTR